VDVQDAPGSHPATTPLLLPVVDSPTDGELVAAARSGDAFAFTRLWRRHESAATTAASATPGRADVEQVVVAAAAVIAQAFRAGGGPAGSVRPYVLGAVREAAATADGRATGPAEGDPPFLAPEAWYADVFPEGMRDGGAVVAAYLALPVAAQEALWLAEIDGRAPAELAAELGLTLPSAEGLLVEARTGIDVAWADAVAAVVPVDSECARVLARRSAGDRATERLRPKVRAHLDVCATCRAAVGEPSVLAHRLTTMLPILVLGGAAGTSFLEATRPGSSSAAVEAVPPVDDRGAVAAVVGAVVGFGSSGPLSDARAIGSAAPTGAAVATARPTATAPLAAVTAPRSMPRRRLAVLAASLGAAAAAAAIVAAVALNGAGTGALRGSLEAAGSADVAEQAPGIEPPVIVATELPPESSDDPDAGGADPAPPTGSDAADPGTGVEDSEDPAATVPDPAPQPDEPADEGSSPPPSEGTGDPGVAPGTPGIRDPVSAPGAPAGAPIDFELSKPQSNGWRTLTLTGDPGAAYTVTSNGTVLHTGVLGADGSAVLAVRGSVADLTAQYGALALTATVDPLAE
jgi:DNA-directed RNA polymerase specialized sigma24 family protein